MMRSINTVRIWTSQSIYSPSYVPFSCMPCVRYLASLVHLSNLSPLILITEVMHVTHDSILLGLSGIRNTYIVAFGYPTCGGVLGVQVVVVTQHQLKRSHGADSTLISGRSVLHHEPPSDNVQLAGFSSHFGSWQFQRWSPRNNS
jgi:hypothetical protein